jgi:hypothetical protein
VNAGLAGSFSRLNSRERTLVGGLLGLVVLLLVGGGVWVVRGKLAEKEAKIKKNRDSWATIQKEAGPFLERQAQQKALIERIKGNPDASSPDNPVAVVAVKSQVRYRASSSDTEDERSPLNKLLHVKGDLAYSSLVSSKGRRKGGPDVQLVEKEFEMRRGYAQAADVYKFLQQVEKLDNLVFVSKLHLQRRSQQPDYVQIKSLTAATLRYVDAEEK